MHARRNCLKAHAMDPKDQAYHAIATYLVRLTSSWHPLPHLSDSSSLRERTNYKPLPASESNVSTYVGMVCR